MPFPTTLTPFPSSGVPGLNNDGAFVAELNPSLSKLVYSTHLPSAEADDSGSGIAVDGAGNVYVTGNTNYPSAVFNAPFVAKLAPSGTVVYNAVLRSRLQHWICQWMA